jgi:hypothetical protein
MDNVSGIAFLGCPHVTYQNKEFWSSLDSLLKYASRLPKIVLAQAELEISVLAEVCQEFEQANIDVPIISAYETMESHLSASIWRSGKSVVNTISCSLTTFMFT